MALAPVYLDYNSTTPLAPAVVDCVTASLSDLWANPSSDTALGRRARDAIHTARAQVAAMVGAADPLQIVFTSGGTESNNMAIDSAVEWGGRQLEGVKPHVIMSNVEHVATTAHVTYLATSGHIDYSECAVNSQGQLEVEQLTALIRPNTVLITLMMANNETGVIFPIQQVARALADYNVSRQLKVMFHVDAAQAIGKISVNVQRLGVDFLTIVGHKFYGPRVGALYVRDRRVARPVVHGGGQEHGLRPGTENTPMIVGLGAAARLVTTGLDEYRHVMAERRDYLLRQLRSQTEGSVVNCEGSPRLPNTLSVAWRGSPLSGWELLARCPALVASTTAACHDQKVYSEVLLRSGVSRELAGSTVRLSVGRSTSVQDIDIAVADIVKALAASAAD